MSAALKNNRNLELIGFLLIAVTILVVLPLTLDAFRLNLVGKYLTYSFVALGLVLCWGYTGILSLGQGVFFGLGGYCMAMFLKLEAKEHALPQAENAGVTPAQHQPGAGRVLRPRRLLHGDVSQARSLERRQHQDPVDARHPRFHGLESDHR